MCETTVTINYEDREQVERLAKAIVEHAAPVQVRHDRTQGSHIDWRVADVQTALREFANPKPPKPEEPRGIGAVVEDSEGVKWVRFKMFETCPWRQAHLPGPTERGVAYYADIDAVRVLSEGVTP